MIKFTILFILFFILITFLIGVGLLAKILRVLFGIRQPASKGQRTQPHRSAGNHRQTRSSDNASPAQPKKKKVFDNDEGEYVDFEEVKDKP